MRAEPGGRAETACQAMSLSGGNGGLRLSFLGAGEVPVLTLSGEFDLENVPEIERFLRRHLGPFFFKSRDLVLDLARVELIDSAFVGLVVSLVGRLHKHRQGAADHQAGRLRAPHHRSGRAGEPGAGLRVARRRAGCPRHGRPGDPAALRPGAAQIGCGVARSPVLGGFGGRHGRGHEASARGRHRQLALRTSDSPSPV